MEYLYDEKKSLISFSRLFFISELISDSAHRTDITGPEDLVYFASEIADIYIGDVSLSFILVSPDALNDLFAGKHDVLVDHQIA